MDQARRVALWAVPVVLCLLMLSATTVDAQTDCSTPDFESAGQQGNEFISLAVVEQLEAAWNTGDPTAALALFADNAVAASSSGWRWQGKVELARFLDQ